MRPPAANRPELLERYRAARDAWGVGEEPATMRRRGELELQAGFYAGEFGLAWRGEDGETVEAVHLGEWNREPGPDFVNAVVRVDGRELRGDIEMDIEAADWERHGHAENPAFNNVLLHVCFRRGGRRAFARNARHEAIPQVLLGSARPERPASGVPAPPAAGAAGFDSAALKNVLEAAVHFRLARKRERWLRAESLHGRSEALFQALATGLGYKNNKIPFLLLAQRLGLRRAGGASGEALLFGVAGFLEASRFDAAGEDNRGYARGLWEAWWPLRAGQSRLMVPAAAWKFAASRPQNHPHRRLGALAALARDPGPLEAAVARGDLTAFLNALAKLHHAFWEHHASLDGARLKQPAALVGSQRAADLAANVLAPAAGIERGLEILGKLRAGSPSGRVRRAAAWLGIPGEQQGGLLASARAQQGLLQIYEDFHPRPPCDVLALGDSLLPP